MNDPETPRKARPGRLSPREAGPMSARPRGAAALTSAEVRARLGQAVATVLVAGVDAAALRPARAGVIRSMPAWVARAGALEGDALLCVWCEPAPEPGETFPSQVTLDLPAGRYMIDALDVRASTWFARESAAGGPVVAGLPYAGGPVLLVVRSLPA